MDQASQPLKDKGIRIVTVGVGDIDKKQMETLSPEQRDRFNPKNFEDLLPLVETMFSSGLCTGYFIITIKYAVIPSFFYCDIVILDATFRSKFSFYQVLLETQAHRDQAVHQVLMVYLEILENLEMLATQVLRVLMVIGVFLEKMETKDSLVIRVPKETLDQHVRQFIFVSRMNYQ